MSREAEKLLKEFHKSIEGKELENEEDLQNELNAFFEKYNSGLNSNVTSMIKSADDFLDMAYAADSKEKTIEYAEKALKLDNNLLDARLLLIQCESDIQSAKKQLEDAIKGETKRLEKEDYFDDDSIGRFWGILETRPYMRARAAYIEVLIEMGKIKKAVAECEDILRLNENDNMGMRYKLMALYAYFEDVTAARELYNRFKEDSFHMLLPMAIMYYKMDDLGKAGNLLKKIIKSNADYKRFLDGELVLDDDEIHEILSNGMYSPGGIEEVTLAFEENVVLSGSLIHFNEWAGEECLKIKS